MGGIAIGGDFDTGGGKGDVNMLRELFGSTATSLGDFKISDSPDNKTSFAKKVLQREMFIQGGAGAFQESKNKRGVEYHGRDLTSSSLLASQGYVPNFYNPLDQAIGREKQAGVPVSKIRVGSHGSLESRSNPLGLGVTNTDDEPGGLKDVFGAKGYVPNFAFGDTKLGKMIGSSGGIEEAQASAQR